jgi:anionic cell wall polymer biosynthesis LytR-Cps2A-Psr (LCP) family protein
MLLNYRPRDSVVALVPLAAETLVQTGSGNSASSARLLELYQRGGATRVMDGIKNTFGVDCEFYVKFDRSSFAGFVSSLGEVQVNIPFDFSGAGVTLPAGEHSLSGGDLFVYINYADFPQAGDDYNLVIMGSAVMNLININCRRLEIEDIQDAFNKIRNNASTNLTFRDYTSYQRALLHTSATSINPAVYYIPSGHYDGSDFIVSNQSKVNVLNKFGLTGARPE